MSEPSDAVTTVEGKNTNTYVEYRFPHGMPASFVDIQQVKDRNMRIARQMPLEATHFRFLTISSGTAFRGKKHAGHYSELDEAGVSPFYDRSGKEVPLDQVFRSNHKPAAVSEPA